MREELIKNKEFRPMLAHKVESNPIDYTQPVFIQAKLDGVRCYITRDGAFTRNGKEIKNVKHIIKDFEKFFEMHPDFIVDGELYNHDLRDNFNKIISLVRKQKTTEADELNSKRLIQFHWYDIVTEEKQRERTARIKSLYPYFKSIGGFNSVVLVDTFQIKNESQMLAMHKQFKLDGYEGSIVRLNGQYKIDGRSKDLLKVKDWHDTEITVTGYVQGKGKFERGLGKFLGTDADGREVEVPWPSLTIEERRKIWSMRTRYIGKELTFEYFERTPDGAYRFPRAKAFRNYE